MKDCLHCTLTDVAQAWFKTHGRATKEDIIDMLGQFVIEVLAQQDPRMADAKVVIMGISFGGGEPINKERLH